MINYYDFSGRVVIVDVEGYSVLVNATEGFDFMAFCRWIKTNMGRRPGIRNAYEVPFEFLEEFREMFESKGLFYSPNNGGGDL